MVVKKFVYDIAKERGMKVSAHYFGPLEARVRVLVTDSLERAKHNGRKTAMAQDI